VRASYGTRNLEKEEDRRKNLPCHIKTGNGFFLNDYIPCTKQRQLHANQGVASFAYCQLPVMYGMKVSETEINLQT
jgi:hypothetical protein